MSSPGSQPGTGQPPQSVPYFYPMARPEDPVWLYVDKFGKQRGPVSLCELRYLIASSQVNSTTLGWREGMENWATLAHLPGVVDVFMEVSANEDGWFYIDDDEVKQGPLSPQLLQQMIISHQLIGSTRMWQPSQLVWKPLSEIEKLMPLYHAAQQLAKAEDDLVDPTQAKKQALSSLPPTSVNAILSGIPSNSSSGSTSGGSGSSGRHRPTATPHGPRVGAAAMAGVKKNLEGGEATNELSDDDGDQDDEEGGEGEGAEKKQNGSQDIRPDSELTPAELAKRQANREKKRLKRERDKLKKEQKKYVFVEQQNARSVYLSGLPVDITVDEIHEFCKRGGLVQKDEQGNPRIKLYRDNQGQPKGDATVFYFKPESVELALDVLNERDIRTGYPVSVSRATFQKRETGLTEEEKEELAKKLQQKKGKKKTVAEIAQEQALLWDETGEAAKNGLRIVLIKGMYTPEEAAESGDAEEFYTDLKLEVARECEKKCGPVHKVSVFPGNREGPVVIKFKTASAAQLCVELMNGRYFAGRKLTCDYYDGKTNLKVEDEKSEEQRLQEFGDMLERS